MASHIVTIQESGGVFVVDTPELHTKKGETVVVHNGTRDSIALFFPEKGLFSDLTDKYTVHEVGAGASSRNYTVKGTHEGKTGDRYAYAVFCHGPGGFALANSNPIIIIDH